MGSITDASYDPTNFNPAPLPEGLLTYDLPKISIAKLIDGDKEESKTMFDICARAGFFYLNLMDHPLGRQLWENACKARNVGHHVMSTLSMEEKEAFLMRPVRGVVDRGYYSTGKDSEAAVKFVEAINIPRDELFAKTTLDWQLPTWLIPYEDFFKEIQTNANAVEQIILGALEPELELEPGSLTKTHELESPTHSFLRILRYPPAGPSAEKLRERPRVLAHKDVVSLAMLFTWVSGLQIPTDDAEMIDPLTPTEESWRWVRPEAGFMIVNLGDAMPVFTNGALKSGLHRVVTPHGDQTNLDRVSVLFTGRPNWEVPMKPFISPKIPPQTAEQAAKPVELCKPWGDGVLQAYHEENLRMGRIR